MSEARTCKFFAKGRCSYGDTCKFIHQADVRTSLQVSSKKRNPTVPESAPRPDAAGSSSPTGRAASSIQPTAQRGRDGVPTSPQTRAKRGEIPCRAWKDGGCSSGAKCWFGHDPQVQEAERLRREHAARAVEQAETKRREHAAEMERQRTARLARLAEQEAVQRARQIELEARKAETRRREAAHTIQHIVLGSSLVTFSAGISIQEVVAGFESCRIQIQNLPGDATHSEIKALFTQQGVDPTRLFITGTKALPDGHLEATLITTSEEGGAIAVGLEDIEFRQERLHFEMAGNGRFGEMGNSARNCDTLWLSWRAPSSCAIVTFQSVDDASAKIKVLNRRVCAGRQVRVEMNQPPPGYARGPSWQRAIKISGLPIFISTETVAEFAGSPFIKFLKPIAYDLDEGLRRLRQQVEITAGQSLKSFDVVAQDDIEGNNTVKVRFADWEEAKAVYDSLAGNRLPYLGNCSLRLRLPDPLQYIMSVPLQQYQAQKRTWDSLTEGARDKTAYINIFPAQSTAKMQIKVLGEDKKAVGSLKVRVENLAGGQQLAANCWHRSFKSTAGTQFLNSLFSQSGAYARADWKLCVVKVYGDPASIDRARDAVKAEVERLDSLESSIFLKKQSIRFFVQQGMATLKEALGDENATLNISPNVAKIVIRGGEEARYLLTRLIDESLEETAGADIQRAITEKCPICYDEISHPVTLACEHTYCMGCLRHYLSTAADSFPLTCLGNEANCGAPIPIPTIESFLPPPQFHQMLETAFLRYIEQHPQEFKYCKTPDCSQVYRSGTATVVSCPSCFLSICPSCDEEAHEGMSCADRRLHSDPGEQERRNDEWARDNGAKRCPACSVWIQKTEGCNHITCRCGNHICWICLRVFDHGEIYEHLSAAHGGAFAVPPELPVQDLRREEVRAPQPAQNLHVHHEEELVYHPLQNLRHEELRALHAQQLEAVRRARARQLQEDQARIMLEHQRRVEQIRLREHAVLQERQQAAAAQRRRLELAAHERRESGWGCIVM
ncbi:hypothetical protein FB451DRAFT_1080157 [Mycena latifolia]|nr:hypothetical protein FB451DRAFT_1080157 [Mycena latifolia]